MNKKETLKNIIEKTDSVSEFQELFYYFKEIGIQKFLDGKNIALEKKDTRKFITVVNEYYDNHNSLRNQITRFRDAVLRAFGSSYYAVLRPSSTSYREKARVGMAITMQDIYDKYEEFGLPFFLNLSERNIGKGTQDSFTLFLEETKQN
jgi:hypothetical protein